MSKKRNRTIQSVCEAHATRRVLDPSNRSHVLAQLEAEGHKRVEAFLFEAHFDRLIAQCTLTTQLGLGWLFQYDSDNRPKYWFKLALSKPTWNTCDDAVLGFLTKNQCKVTRIQYAVEGSEFLAERYDGSQWEVREPINDALANLTGRMQPLTKPRDYSYINKQFQEKAIEMIDKHLSDEECFNLSVTRTFVNCYLYPWFHKQPMDIDACYLQDQELRFIEFKRKYPTRRNTFGIDEHPHATLSDWLEKHQSRLSHIILCDPLWDKYESPLHLLAQDSPTREYATWLGLHLDRNAFTGSTLQTIGSDSGMFGGHRSQREMSIGVFWELGFGLEPQKLCAFLNGSDVLVHAHADELVKRRDQARRLHKRRAGS